ncbi:class I SAM-dependent RNA methyltransferase [Actinomycetospora cinnamomea]|uniref:tRNA/tmRNA/rRNA uracil-C5-methylase (TrmA/RlmC/RlmD family) n=1 Tax=Actinomycetospora cinnamomea TaxID=663609 RepID=A0A2U1FPY1_9PSEU|nr:TRAM domain-containing protein [Actinomycetospora cinnamomea]PVZ14253.1 tRNA/tmRNA/rRNA uracil-C5-methylase (TrmA/RlmC/RlmD family) [Actinomycetospora cinnamomea]
MTAPRQTLDWTDRLLELDVGPVAHGGHCVARSEGRVVFVRHALPGERVRAVVTEDGGGSFCRADAVAVLTASPDRVEPACPWAGPGGCGGCDWQHASPAAQRQLKAAVVAEQLARLAGIEREVTVEELPGGPLGWRTRMRMAVTDDGRPGLRAHRSHEVLPVGDCPIAAPGALLPVLERSWTPTAEVEIVRDAAGEVHAVELFEGERHPELGDGTAHERAAGRAWELPAEAFWQVHPHAADAVVDAVLEGVGDLEPGACAWDLYGGAGLIAAPLAERVGAVGTVGTVGSDGCTGSQGRVVLVESDPAATAAAGECLADLPAVQVVRGRVEKVLHGLPGPPAVIVADPPRKGLGRRLAGELARQGAARIVLVACDPAALARDVAALAEHGYALAGLRAFDAFPMTHHVECVATLLAT